MTDANVLTQEYLNALIHFDQNAAEKTVQKAMQSNEPNMVFSILEKAMVKIGEDWSNELLALSQVYMAGVITENIIQNFFPETEEFSQQRKDTAIVTLGDYHVLGKKIIHSAMRISGMNVLDLGHGLSPEEIVALVKINHIRVLLVSVLMYPTALQVLNLRQLLQKENLELKIMVGGAPFNFDSQLWQQVGADAYGYNATDAINFVNSQSADHES